MACSCGCCEGATRQGLGRFHAGRVRYSVAVHCHRFASIDRCGQRWPDDVTERSNAKGQKQIANGSWPVAVAGGAALRCGLEVWGDRAACFAVAWCHPSEQNRPHNQPSAVSVTDHRRRPSCKSASSARVGVRPGHIKGRQFSCQSSQDGPPSAPALTCYSAFQKVRSGFWNEMRVKT